MLPSTALEPREIERRQSAAEDQVQEDLRPRERLRGKIRMGNRQCHSRVTRRGGECENLTSVGFWSAEHVADDQPSHRKGHETQNRAIADDGEYRPRQTDQ